MKLLEGKKISDKILANIKKKIKSEDSRIGLAVVLVVGNKSSEIYVRLKKKAAEKIGIKFYLYKFTRAAGEKQIIAKIKKLNADKKINGIIVQLPLPKKLNTQKIINAIDPRKDADGFHPDNLETYLEGKCEICPVFSSAIARIIQTVPKTEFSKILKLGFRKELKAVIIANSKEFGSITEILLGREKINAKYILYKQWKKYLPQIKKADILISAVGKPKLIKAEMIKKGAIVIDGGITKKGKKVLGDVDFKSVKNKSAYLTPVPGGVGPVTIACLLENVYLLSKKSK